MLQYSVNLIVIFVETLALEFYAQWSWIPSTSCYQCFCLPLDKSDLGSWVPKQVISVTEKIKAQTL